MDLHLSSATNDVSSLAPDFRKRRPELDGIRGTAILSILIYHWVITEGGTLLPRWVQAIGGFGWAGVDLFFVLSGFLIGGILIDARRATNYFRVFYLRRAYRILPLYVVLCIFSVAVFYAPLSTHSWLFENRIPWYAYATFAQNFWMAKYHALGSRQIDATWSLAIEEQFYLTLPLAIRITRDRHLPRVLLAGIILAPLLRIVLWFTLTHEYRDITIYVLAPCRMDSLLLGVLAAWIVRHESAWRFFASHRDGLRALSVALGLGIVLMVRMHWSVSSFQMISWGYTWIAMFALSLLLLAVTQRGGVLKRLFCIRPLTSLGVLAYGLYLFHQPVLGLVYALISRPSPEMLNLSDLLVTLCAALLLSFMVRFSWRYFEEPLVRIGHGHKYLYSVSL